MFLNPNATTFTLDQLKESAKKRYRDQIHEDDLKGALEDAIKAKQTLAQATEALVALYVETDGHERNLILTVEELAARKLKDDKRGIVKAIIAVMRRPNGATELDLKAAVRFQTTLRKLKVDPVQLGSHIVATLVDQQYSVTQSVARGPLTWCLLKKPRAKMCEIDKLNDEQMEELCPSFEQFIIRERGRYQTHEIVEC